jgi:hypothetical protein
LQRSQQQWASLLEPSRVAYRVDASVSLNYFIQSAIAMTDPNEILPDELLEDILQPLRSVEVPADAKSTNRVAVMQSLAARVRPAWWQRTIAVPVPVAIAASILLLLAGISLVRPFTAGRAIEQSTQISSAQPPNDAKQETSVVSNEANTAAWSIRRSFIRTLTSSTGSEFVASNALENRDDS